MRWGRDDHQRKREQDWRDRNQDCRRNRDWRDRDYWNRDYHSGRYSGQSQGSEYYRERRLPFYRRNDGYDNYYGHEDMEQKSLTSKILSGLMGLASKAKPNAKKEPSANSSNLTYNSAEKGEDYLASGVIKEERG